MKNKRALAAGLRRNPGRAVQMGKRLSAALALAVFLLPQLLPAARGQEPLRAEFSISAATVAPGGSLTASALAAGGTAPYTYTFVWTIRDNGVDTELPWESNQQAASETRTIPSGQSGSVAVTVSDYQLSRVSQTLYFTIAVPATQTPAPTGTPAPTATPAPNLRPAPAVTGITAVTGTSLRLTWNRVAGAAGYEAWRSDSRLGTYRLVFSTTATAYTNTCLTPGARYYYKLRTYDLVDGVKTPSGMFSAAYAGVPVAGTRVTGAVRTTARTTLLSYARAPGATGYAIYKAAAAAGPYVPWRTTSATSYLLTLAPGTILYVRIRPYARIYTANYFGPLSAYYRVKQ